LAGLYDEDRIVFENAGNHDMMVVGMDNDILNRYRHYTMHGPEPFAVRSYAFPDNFSVPVNILIYNPFAFRSLARTFERCVMKQGTLTGSYTSRV
jgi:hypothetical protein